MSAHAIGRYTVLRELGAGGMGEIFLARDPGLDRHVALKLLRAKLADDPEVRDRFRREARALAALSHPGIVTIYEIGHDEGRDFIAMEYLAGRTLRKALEDGAGSSSWKLIVATRTAIAVAAAHRAGVLHRDIKPENIMITDDNTVKVVDFGLAHRLADGASGPEDTGRLEIMFETTMRLDARGKPDKIDQETNTIFGTPGYMAPEILRGSPANEAADVYALGVVVFEAIAGRLPYSGRSFTETLAQVLDGGTPPPRLDEIGDCARALADTVARMLAHAPDERPSMEEAAQALAEAAAEAQAGELASEHGVPASGAVASYDRPLATERVAHRRRRAPLVIGLVAAVSAAAAVIALVATGSSAPAPPPAPGSFVVAVGPIDMDDSAFGAAKFKRTGVPVLLGSLLDQVPAIRVISTDRIVSVAYARSVS